VLRGEPSRTAKGAALYRAAHQLADEPRVFEDPLALKIIGKPAEAELRAGRDRRTRPRAAPLRAFIAVRSRYAEDSFASAYARGVRQYVVLGAGLDTFAYRSRLEGVRVIEVDHPSTQRWKREQLRRAAIDIPETVVYAPVDFERETLREGLARVAFDSTRCAFLAWLGVTPYLTATAVTSTLRAMAREMALGSEIVFDFATPAPKGRAGRARQELARRVEAAGEPLRSAFDPMALEACVRALGFSQVAILDHVLLQARYFKGRKDGLALRGGQLVHARL